MVGGFSGETHAGVGKGLRAPSADSPHARTSRRTTKILHEYHVVGEAVRTTYGRHRFDDIRQEANFSSTRSNKYAKKMCKMIQGNMEACLTRKPDSLHICLIPTRSRSCSTRFDCNRQTTSLASVHYPDCSFSSPHENVTRLSRTHNATSQKPSRAFTSVALLHGALVVSSIQVQNTRGFCLPKKSTLLRNTWKI